MIDESSGKVLMLYREGIWGAGGGGEGDDVTGGDSAGVGVCWGEISRVSLLGGGR